METDKVYCEDCLEGMKRIPDGSVDMILTDPPFGTTSNWWDKRIPMEPLWEQLKRVTKHNAAIVIFSQLPFAVDVINANRKMFRYEWVWHKTNPVGFLNANKMPLRAHENILVFYRHLPTYNPQYWQSKPYKTHNASSTPTYGKKNVGWLSTSDGKRFPLDVIKYKSQADPEKMHSTQKPVGLLEYLIRTYTNEGELVLDACMGSGSTAVACVNSNRHFIGFETHQPYVDIANRRIDEAHEQLSQTLFKEVTNGDHN